MPFGTLWQAVTSRVEASGGVSKIERTDAAMEVDMRICRKCCVAMAMCVLVHSNVCASELVASTVPPRISAITPSPGGWITNNSGLTEFTVTFDQPVKIWPDSIKVFSQSLGLVSPSSIVHDVFGQTVRITFAQPFVADRVTLLLDYHICNQAAILLDGEITTPLAGSLPSGDGFAGGHGVFRFDVLRGDASRDGVMNVTDDSRPMTVS